MSTYRSTAAQREAVASARELYPQLRTLTAPAVWRVCEAMRANVDASLSRFPVAALYIVANLALGVHLFHGAWSLFQSLGLNNPRFNAWRRNFAAGFAAIVVVGNVSFPIAVLAGVVGS